VGEGGLRGAIVLEPTVGFGRPWTVVVLDGVTVILHRGVAHLQARGNVLFQIGVVVNKGRARSVGLQIVALGGDRNRTDGCDCFAIPLLPLPLPRDTSSLTGLRYFRRRLEWRGSYRFPGGGGEWGLAVVDISGHVAGERRYTARVGTELQSNVTVHAPGRGPLVPQLYIVATDTCKRG